jgi:type IV pilus assembly protein PilE
MKIHFKSMKNRGFTLIEILIVIVLIAILAGMAIPVYQASVAKSYRAEALGVLASLRHSQIRRFSEVTPNAYVTATTAQFNAGTAPLDFNPVDAASQTGQDVHFTYACVAAAGPPSTFTCTATRNAVDPVGPAPGLGNGDTVVINHQGTVTGTGIFA